MKKIFYLIVGILLTVIPQNTYAFCDNSVPIINYDKKLIENEYNNSEFKGEEIYVITTYKIDSNDNVIDQRSIEASKEEAEAVAKDNTLHILDNGKLSTVSPISIQGYEESWAYETESKRIQTRYYTYGGKYYAEILATWIKLPKIRKFDVIALRWDSCVKSIDYFYATQYGDSNTGKTEYTSSSKNVVITSEGVGVSMDLHDSYKNNAVIYLKIGSAGNFGTYMYGTYQHAKNSNVTLAISKSYTFGISGLGGVLVFNKTSYSNYYDQMQGLKFGRSDK